MVDQGKPVLYKCDYGEAVSRMSNSELGGGQPGGYDDGE